MLNTGLDEAQVGIKTSGRNINNVTYTDDTTHMAESKEELNSTFRKLTSWHLVPSLHGEQMGKQWQTFFGGAPKSLQMVIAVMKLKDACLLLGTKVATNRDSLFKSRDITLVRLVKAMVFPVVMYGYESWTIKIAEY